MREPNTPISVDTVSGASPPNSVTAMLYESATHIERVAVGKSCVSMSGSAPDITLSTTVAIICAANTRSGVGEASTHENSGHAVQIHTMVTGKNKQAIRAEAIRELDRQWIVSDADQAGNGRAQQRVLQRQMQLPFDVQRHVRML